MPPRPRSPRRGVSLLASRLLRSLVELVDHDHRRQRHRMREERRATVAVVEGAVVVPHLGVLGLRAEDGDSGISSGSLDAPSSSSFDLPSPLSVLSSPSPFFSRRRVKSASAAVGQRGSIDGPPMAVSEREGRPRDSDVVIFVTDPMGAVSSRERRGSSLGCWSSKSSTRHHEDGDEDQYAPAKPSKLRLEVRGESRATTTTSCYDLPTPVSDDSDSPPLALSSNERLLQIIRCFPFPSPRSSPRESPRLRRKEVNENEAKQRRSHSLERNGDDGRFRHVMGQLVQVSVETMAITALPKESIDCWLKERLKNWFQLSGHEGSIVPASSNSLYKKQTGLCTEGRAYQLIHEEPLLSPFAPKFYQQIEKNCETFIEIEDLLSHFSKPAATTIMDVKIGTRTFLESEVNNPVLREQLYEKMIKIDPFEPTEEEREQRAITKLRYMQYRETQSSTATLGFRIEAAKMPGGTTEKEFKKVHTAEDVEGVFKTFLGDDRKRVAAGLLKRLQGLRTAVEASRFFASHEVVGSSLLLMFDNDRVGVWMIDFAKAVKHCSGLSLTHRAEWVQGNGEDGYLTGIDNLIQIFERLVAECH